jgi:hypothetical protein
LLNVQEKHTSLPLLPKLLKLQLLQTQSGFLIYAIIPFPSLSFTIILVCCQQARVDGVVEVDTFLYFVACGFSSCQTEIHSLKKIHSRSHSLTLTLSLSPHSHSPHSHSQLTLTLTHYLTCATRHSHSLSPTQHQHTTNVYVVCLLPKIHTCFILIEKIYTKDREKYRK